MIGRIGNDKIGILLVSVPKSGTHFLIEILQQTFGSYFLYRGGWGDKPENSVQWLNKTIFKKNEMEDPLLASKKRTRAMAPNHTANGGLGVLENAIKNNNKIRGIFLYRDPRDILISMVHSSLSGIWPEGKLEAQLKHMSSNSDRYRWMLSSGGPGKTNFSRWLESYSGYRGSQLFYNLRYEDLLTMRKGGGRHTQGKVIDELSTLLNCCSLELAEGLISASHKSSWTHRKGGATAGQWRDKFDATVKEKTKNIMGQQLIAWGYEKSLNW